MLYKTEVFNRAALFTTIGGELVEIEGKYPHNVFVLEVTWWQIIYEKVCGWIPYKKFVRQRIRIKRKARKLAGLPASFLGDGKPGFTFGDLAVVKRIDK